MSQDSRASDTTVLVKVSNYERRNNAIKAPSGRGLFYQTIHHRKYNFASPRHWRGAKLCAEARSKGRLLS